MKITPSNVKPNMMRLRHMYYNTIIKTLTDIHSSLWEHVCSDFLTENNEILGQEYIAFSYKGEMYPPQVVAQTRSALLRRKSSALVEDLHDEFEKMYKDLVQEWEVSLRALKNLLGVAFREAKDPLDIEDFLPAEVVQKLESLDFIPLPNAKGLNSQRKAELRDEYPKAFDIGKFLSIGNFV